MAYILNIETATTNCSVSLSFEGETLVLQEDNSANYSHAEKLHLYIDAVLTEANIGKDQLSAIAVSQGPGSYTGLRIGVSTVKGLCYALNLPMIAVPTLEILAHQVSATEGYIVPILDARRMEVYSSVFDANYKVIRETKAEVLTTDLYNHLLDESSVYFVGNAVDKARSIIQHENAIFVDETLPSAKDMCTLAYAKFQKNDFEDVAYFEPFYLKDFIVLKPKS